MLVAKMAQFPPPKYMHKTAGLLGITPLLRAAARVLLRATWLLPTLGPC